MIDPRKRVQRQAIREACAARNIKIKPRGQAWVLRGADVDLMVCDLAELSIENLEPYRSQSNEAEIRQA